MRLTYIGTDPLSNPNQSPTIYRTDRGSWLVQGWKVTDHEALAEIKARGLPDHEDIVEIPDRMLPFFRMDT